MICDNSGAPQDQALRPVVVYNFKHELHHPPDPEVKHSEIPERMNATINRLKNKGLLEKCLFIDEYSAYENVIEKVHEKTYIEYIQNLAESGGKDGDTYCSKGSYEAAIMAASGCCLAVDKILNHQARHGYAIVRPPGHHALTSKHEIEGFCIFNNVAIAVRYAQEKYGIKKVAILDWDVHHGDSTQKVFYDDPRVLFCSIHKYQNGYFYPGSSGFIGNIGEGEGKGYNLNIPWDITEDAGICRTVGDNEYVYIFERIIYPLFKEYDPELIFVSAGFDSANGDYLGGISVTPYCYAYITKRLMELNKNIILASEGGYNCDIIPVCAEYCLRTILGEDIISTNAADKFSLEKMKNNCLPSKIAQDLASNLIYLHKGNWPILLSNSLVDYENTVKNYAKQHFQHDLLFSVRPLSIASSSKLIKTFKAGEEIFYRMIKSNSSKIQENFKNLKDYLLEYSKSVFIHGDRYSIFKPFVQDLENFSYIIFKAGCSDLGAEREFYQNKNFRVTKILIRDEDNKIIEKWDEVENYGLNYDMKIDDWHFDKFILSLRHFLSIQNKEKPNLEAFKYFRKFACDLKTFFEAVNTITFESISFVFLLDNKSNRYCMKIIDLEGIVTDPKEKSFSPLVDIFKEMVKTLHDDENFVLEDVDEN